MIRLNNAKMQEELRKIPGTTVNHTPTHTVVSSKDYVIYIKNIKTDRRGKAEEATSHRVLWDEKKHYKPLSVSHLVLRYQVSKALGAADE